MNNLQKVPSNHAGNLFLQLKQAWKALETLSRIRTRYPHLRLGQILANAINNPQRDIFYVTDGELAKLLIDYEKFLDEERKRLNKQK